MTDHDAAERARLLHEAAGGRVHQDRWMIALFDRLVGLREDLAEFKGEMRARDAAQNGRLAEHEEEIRRKIENGAETVSDGLKKARLVFYGTLVTGAVTIAVVAIQTFGPR